MHFLTTIFFLGLAAAQEQPCAPHKTGAAPIADPHSVDAFANDPIYSELAENATIPIGYSPAFSDLDGAYQNPVTYLIHKELDAYSTQQCADYCAKRAACKAFNVFVIREPTLVCIVLHFSLLLFFLKELVVHSISILPLVPLSLPSQHSCSLKGFANTSRFSTPPQPAPILPPQQHTAARFSTPRFPSWTR
jgi:hypothetical protein